MKTNPKTQSERFIEAARDLGADEDEAKFNATLKKVASAKPAPEKPADPEKLKRKRDG